MERAARGSPMLMARDKGLTPPGADELPGTTTGSGATAPSTLALGLRALSKTTSLRDSVRLMEERSGTPLAEKNSRVSLYCSTTPVNLYVPQPNSMLGGTLPPPSSYGRSSLAILSVVSRTSEPVSVVSNTRSIVSLAVLPLTNCTAFFFFESVGAKVFVTVYCKDAGLKCTLTGGLSLSGPASGLKYASATVLGAGVTGIGLSLRKRGADLRAPGAVPRCRPRCPWR